MAVQQGHREREAIARGRVAALEPKPLSSRRPHVARSEPRRDARRRGRRSRGARSAGAGRSGHARGHRGCARRDHVHDARRGTAPEKDGPCALTVVEIPALLEGEQAARRRRTGRQRPTDPPGPPRPEQPETSAWGTQHTLAVVAASGGVVALGVGTVFALKAASTQSDADAKCTSAGCSPEGKILLADAGTSADVATVTFVVGAALVATGAVLWLTSPSLRASAVGDGARSPRRPSFLSWVLADPLASTRLGSQRARSALDPRRTPHFPGPRAWHARCTWAALETKLPRPSHNFQEIPESTMSTMITKAMFAGVIGLSLVACGKKDEAPAAGAGSASTTSAAAKIGSCKKLANAGKCTEYQIAEDLVASIQQGRLRGDRRQVGDEPRARPRSSSPTARRASRRSSSTRARRTPGARLHDGRGLREGRLRDDERQAHRHRQARRQAAETAAAAAAPAAPAKKAAPAAAKPAKK